MNRYLDNDRVDPERYEPDTWIRKTDPLIAHPSIVETMPILSASGVRRVLSDAFDLLHMGSTGGSGPRRQPLLRTEEPINAGCKQQIS
jgi:hypothetical protein